MTSQTNLLANKIVLITGASSGIGAESALVFAREGATVVLAATDEHRLDEATRAVTEAGGTATWVRADVSVADDVGRMVDTVVQRHGRIDGAFNNAGLSQGGAPLADLDEDRFDRIWSVNVKGVWLCMRAEIWAMLTVGTGAIVNASSIAGLRGRPGLSTYAATKHAVAGLTRSGAQDYGRAGLRINGLAAGTVDTPMIAAWAEAEPAVAQQLIAVNPMGRRAHTSEVAEAAAWLLSDRASYVNGSMLTIDGGLTA